jgi:predicted Zn-dependent peptidase
MKRKMWIAIVVGACAAVIATLAAAQQGGHAPTQAAPTPLERLPIERQRLENGLRIVLSPDRTIPTVAIAIYYDVGSRNEPHGRSGFAHLFEHMMFQGSANVAKGQHFSLIMNRGGSLNGTTSHDRTNYFETLPSNELALGLWLEADRMRSLAVTGENFENQRQVVTEEYRQSYENQPYALSFLRINELAFGDYWPYSHSTIGSPCDPQNGVPTCLGLVDIEHTPLSAVQEFWRTHYAPNNAVLTISGDFDREEAMRMIRRYFGNIPQRQVPPYRPPQITPQTTERTETMHDRLAELPGFHIDYHIPPDREVDHYALEMMAVVLGDGESSRLYQELVKERELVQEIEVGTDDRRGPDLFSFWAIVAAGHTGAEVRPRIYAQLERIAREGVTPRELQKAQNRVRASFVFGLQSNLQRARQLAEYELYWGNAELIRSELGRYLAVTNDDIKRVAGQYFATTNRSVLDVVPAAPPQPAEAARRRGGAR